MMKDMFLTKRNLIERDENGELGNVAYNCRNTGIYIKLIQKTFVFGFYLSSKGKKYFKLRLYEHKNMGICYFRFWDGQKYFLKFFRLVKLQGEGANGPTVCETLRREDCVNETVNQR